MNFDKLQSAVNQWNARVPFRLNESQFEAFETALYEANQVMNLTRVAREDCWERHFLDSLAVGLFIPEGASILDIGTGPGFPAWPLAAARPDLTVTAIDSNGKMLGFLKHQLLPNMQAFAVRAEEWEQFEAFDLVTGRAVAPLAIQLEISAPLCGIGGLVIPMRTAHDDWDDRVIGNLGLKLRRVETVVIGEATRIFPIFEKVRPTPKKYPRRWADIKKKPLF